MINKCLLKIGRKGGRRGKKGTWVEKSKQACSPSRGYRGDREFELDISQ